ncbi:MAG: helix-turn-helix transcriptional regulator [Miltoncostaeaceae bacterium]
MIVPEPAQSDGAPPDLRDAEAIVFGDRARRRPGMPPGPRSAELTQREREILLMVSQGLSNGDSARVLELSIETVKSHMRRVLGKLGARNRCHAVALAYEYGILSPGGLKRITYESPALRREEE